ncbi:MAG: SMP-30/gluconolactonase/LRE family protein [Armatimonadota bacterium]|nr:SMP-30/gluconolactonase/LRE family protein [Armatimonadota bacterium]
MYSYRETLCYRQPPHITRGDIEHFWVVELSYGMQITQEGSRWVCQWEAEALRRFTVEHVLLHEIGHHVCFRQRRQEGFQGPLRHIPSEQFAEDYALRLQRLIDNARARMVH